MPTIGIVMPTFNQSQFLAAAVATSLPHADKLVIVNDASTDGTREWLDALDTQGGRIVVVHHEQNIGGTAARPINTGRAVLGDAFDWHTWHSSDNTYPADWRDRMLAHAALDVGAIFSGFGYCSPGSPRETYIFQQYDGKQIEREACGYGPSFLIRPAIWTEAGEHHGGSAHDLGHWLRVEEACWRRGLRIVGVDESLCHYNAHDQRCGIRRPDLYDAREQLAEARARRALVTA